MEIELQLCKLLNRTKSLIKTKKKKQVVWDEEPIL